MESLSWTDILNSALSEPGRMLEAYSAFHQYSLGNQTAAMFQLLLRGQKISPIASFSAWKEKGRMVRAGEKAIMLCMPITFQKKEKGKDENPDGGAEEKLTFRRFVWRKNWFSVDQTEGAEISPSPEIQIPAWDKASALSSLEISEEDFQNVDGNMMGYARRRTIAVSPFAPFPHKTRFHEMAHVLLGHTEDGDVMVSEESITKSLQELTAEGVAYVLCSILELPGLEESRGYMQSWFEGGQVPEKAAQQIFSVADKILKAGAIPATS